MRTIFTVFRKELVDTIRDRRTLMFMFVIPLLVFPILFKVMFTVEKSQRDKASAKTLRVACVTNGNAGRFIEMLSSQSDIEFVSSVPIDSVGAFIRSDKLDGAFVFRDDFDADVAALGSGRVDFYHKSTEDREIVASRMRSFIEDYEAELLAARLAQLELDKDIMRPVDVREKNVASMQERIGSEVGGFLPYIFILFCFMGAMYPAIDLGAGEKERGTLETLLTAPVDRFHILLGKFGVIMLSGLLSAVVSMVGLFIGVRQAGEIPPEIMSVIVTILGADNIILLFTLLIPLTIFFAGVLLSVSLTAKTFKEAQSMISPLNIAVLVPAAIGVVPGVEMNFATALIPVLNVSLATKAIVAGTMQTSHLIVVYVSLIAFAMLSLALAAQWFKRESVIFRT